MSSASDAHPPVAAVIVAFHPEPMRLRKLIEVLSRECTMVYLADNGGAAAALGCSAPNPKLQTLNMDGNHGIGAALNEGFERARSAGAEFVISFDQDSRPAPGLVGNLLAAFARLRQAGIDVAAVGPRARDFRREPPSDYPFMRRRFGWPRAVFCAAAGEPIEVDYLMTSGCLVPLDAYRSVGPFDASLFIDCVDIEWCFRASSKQQRIFAVCAAEMAHEIGAGSARFLGLSVSRHSPLRRYYYSRNTTRLLGAAHVRPGWKMRMAMGLVGRTLLLPFAARFAKGWMRDWGMLLRGVRDGLGGVSGRYTGDADRDQP